MPSHKRKGDRAELEAAALIEELLGYPTRRQLGAGRLDDVGDIDVPMLPELTIQVADWKDAGRATREKPAACELQRVNRSALFAATFIRFRGGTWRVCLTPEQWAAYVRSAHQLPHRQS